MPRLQSLNSTAKSAWSEYGGWIILLVTAYMLFSFRKVFSSLGNAAGAKAEAVVANAQAEADKKKQQAAIQAATGSSVKFSDAQLAAFDADARTLAGYLGTLDGGGFRLFANDGDAFSMLKQHYSRLNLHNNKPWKWKDPKKRTGVVPQTVENKDSVKNPYNYKVLIASYKAATGGGRDLVNDFRTVCTKKEMVALFKWIL